MDPWLTVHWPELLQSAGIIGGLDEAATEVFPGYCPHYYLAYAECLLMHGAGDQTQLVQDLIRRAREVGKLSENPWVPHAADHIEQNIKRSP